MNEIKESRVIWVWEVPSVLVSWGRGPEKSDPSLSVALFWKCQA